MKRQERLERLLKIRQHERDKASSAMQRAQLDARAAEAAAQAARERRGNAEQRALAAASKPQSAQEFLAGRFEVLELIDQERLQDLRERRMQRTLALRRIDLTHSLVREEQIRHLDATERRRRQAADIQSEQKALDDMRREGGDPAW